MRRRPPRAALFPYTTLCRSFSAPLYFQTPAAATTPAVPTPAGPGTTGSPGPTTASSTVVLNWGTVSGATSYDVAVRDLGTNTIVVSQTLSGTSYTAALTAGGQDPRGVAVEERRVG